MTCGNNPGSASTTLNIAAGGSITWRLDNTLYHSGPASIYLGKVPSGQTAATWNGSGANWFKVPIPPQLVRGPLLMIFVDRGVGCDLQPLQIHSRWSEPTFHHHPEQHSKRRGMWFSLTPYSAVADGCLFSPVSRPH